VRLSLPRETDGHIRSHEPFDVLATELDALVELKPEGKVSSYFFAAGIGSCRVPG